MKVELKKFGSTLTSRQLGKEALLAIRPILKDVGDEEDLVVDFSGVVVFSPSWADEFLTPLKEEFGDRLKFVATDNVSVKATLEFLDEIG